jgi:hypothetical protein
MAGTQVRAEIVARCLAEVRGRRIHQHFAGYLCVKRTAARFGRTTKLRPEWKEFFDTFLRLPDASPGFPYAVAFVGQGSDQYLNRNVAGSYAPSSLREGKALGRVIGVDEHDAYFLRDRHWELAQKHLARGTQVPIVSLVAFLYRDFSLKNDKARAADLVRLFRDEFGYPASEEGNMEFNSLYVDNSATSECTDWFEAVP